MRPRHALLAVAASVGAAAYWWRKNPSACPYGQRFWVEAPHPFITRARLSEILAPHAGEHLLEVGPGTGYYTLDVARAITPGGVLDIFDLQQQIDERVLVQSGRWILRATTYPWFSDVADSAECSAIHELRNA